MLTYILAIKLSASMLTTFSLQHRLKTHQTNNNKAKGRQTSNCNGYCLLCVLVSSSYTNQTCHMYNTLGSICNNHKSKCITIKDPPIPITRKDQFLSLSTYKQLVFDFYNNKKRNHPGAPLNHVSPYFMHPAPLGIWRGPLVTHWTIVKDLKSMSNDVHDVVHNLYSHWYDLHQFH